jgi:hypothetical protein
MKRYILIIAFALGLGLNLNAQSQRKGHSDGFFSRNYSEYNRDDDDYGVMPLLPGHNTLNDYDADPKQVPVGSGLLLLAGLGLAYGLKKKIEN